MSEQPQHPVQPLVTDSEGVLRFKANAIVRYLLDNGPFNLNDLALLPFSNEDREQFAQLIGYSLSGFGDLSYVSDETYDRAESQGGETKETLSLNIVLELLRDTLIVAGYVGPNRLIEGAVLDMARNVWLEHVALPELPVTAIIYRHVYGGINQVEREFWRQHGFSAEVFANVPYETHPPQEPDRAV